MSEKQSNNIDFKKLDSNGDENVWELCIKRDFDKSLTLWSFRVIVFGVIICFAIFYAPLLYDKILPMVNIGQKTLFALFLLLLAISPLFISLYLIFTLILDFYNTLNIKAIFATKQYLVIKCYLSPNITMPLGSLYVAEERGIFTRYYADTISIHWIKDELYGYSFLNPFCQTNIFELNALASHQIKQTLIKLNDKMYALHKMRIQSYKTPNLNIDFTEIDKLREEYNAK